jgi:hypothetical protein
MLVVVVVLFLVVIVAMAFAYQKASIYYYDDQQKFFQLAFTITAVGAAALFVLFLVSGDAIAAIVAVGKS